MPKYGEKITKTICDMIVADDFTVEEICKQVGIGESTFYEWQQTIPEFSDEIKNAREKRLEVFKKAARSGLLKLLQGATTEEVITEYKEIKVGNDDQGFPIFKPRMISQKIKKSVILPNPTSVIFALKNVDSDNFNEIIKQTLTGANGEPLIPPEHKIVHVHSDRPLAHSEDEIQDD